MTTNTNNKYTDLTQSKRLKEIGFNTQEDGYWVGVEQDFKSSELTYHHGVRFKNLPEGADKIKSYRLDTLLLGIKPIVWDSIQYYAWALKEKDIDFIRMSVANRFDLEEARRLYIKIVKQQGSQAIAAAVDLICLLKEVK